MKYYKFINEHNSGPYSGFVFAPYLPANSDPGPWLPEVEDLKLCESGYHACTAEHLSLWVNAQLWEVEYKDEPERDKDKVNGHCIRFVRKVKTWNDRTARLFAVWCAREALALMDDPDPRSLAACDVAERYANGEATDKELDAARDAARAARPARAAAGVAARVAARVAAGYAAWDAAWAAAGAAAGYAARDAAWYAARDAARDAQNKKLLEMLEVVK